MIRAKIITLIFALFLAASTATAVPVATVDHEITTRPVTGDKFYRTELYIGRSIPGGGMVSDQDWQRFLAEVVTPRFPDGFTIVDATGQYREQNGSIDKENTEILIFLYPVKKRTASRRKIEEIRRAYVKEFKQESVLRLDYPTAMSVKF